MKIPIILYLLLLVGSQVSGQLKTTEEKADSMYFAKDYAGAAAYYQRAIDSLPAMKNPAYLFYNKACCYAINGESAKAMQTFEMAVNEYGYKNYDHSKQDADLVSLHDNPRWNKLMAKMKADQDRLAEPAKSKLVTTDIHHFWKAYDLAQQDSSNRKAIYEKEYFGKSSFGLQDYFQSKIGGVDAFIKTHSERPRFYAAIRNNTLSIDSMKPRIYSYFNKFKSLYPKAIFPDIYFVIGRFSSAGTVSDNGLLIGVDMISKSPEIPVEELSLWQKNNLAPINKLPVIVIHELVHAQQANLKRDTTLLSYALLEGMADFICELVTGFNPNQRQQDYAQTRRKEVWADFKKEIYLNRYSNWIANGSQETKDKPADLGYYVGYEICKAYYENATDKKQAIFDMLNIQDYPAFLAKSRYEEKVSGQ